VGGTTYYYVVSAVNDGGESANSAQAAATPPVAYFQVNSGGAAASPFVADANFSGGGTYSTGASIDTSGVTNPAPMAVYQTERYGNMTYTFPGLTAGTSYKVRLHFAELYWSTSGSRKFNVVINGTQVLTNFDIYATAGAKNKAVVREFVTVANGSGQVVVQYVNVVDSAKSSGIEVLSTDNPSAPPAAPTGLAATGGNAVVNLNWTQSTSSGITGNNVYRSTTGSGGPYNLLANLAATTSYPDTAVVNGSTYYYSATAVNGNGESSLSAYAGATPNPTAPPAPTGLSATAGNAQVALTWNASSGATSYNVKRATVSGGPYTTIASPTGTSYTDTTAVNGTTYYYVVTAVNAAGESGNSNEASATPQAAPAAPTGLTATAASSSQIDLSWTASAGATSYNVKRATVSGGPYTTIATGVTGTSYSNTGLSAGTTYYYVVSAVNAGGESANSAEASAATRIHIEAETFSTQSGVQTETCSDTGGGLDVGYINNADWCSYTNVNFGTGSSVFWARVASAGSGGTIEIHLDSVTGTLAGTVSVAATGGWQTWTTVSGSINASGIHTVYLVFTGGSGYLFNFNWFECQSGGASAPSAPTGLSATAGDNQVALSWTASSGATSYNVKRATVSGGPYSTIGSPTSPSYTDTTAVNGTTYYYVVSAVNSAGESANSAQVSATPSCSLPSVPAGLSATPGDAQVALSWSAASGATSYNVKRSTTSGSGYVTIASPTGTSYTDTTAVNGTTYYYVVSAVNACGESANSSQASATPVAAPPTFVAAGAVSSGTATITPALPSGIASGDVLLLFVETANEAVSISNPNGGTWTEVTGSPQGTGTAGSTSAARLTAFWSRYNGTQGAPTVSDSGNHQLARMVAIRGAAASGNPWDVTAGGVEATSDTSGSIPGATTTVANTLVVVAVAGSGPDATGTSNFSGWANANLTGLTERTDNTVTAGNGGALGIATGVKTTAGAYGNTTVTLASSAAKGMISIAIKK
jgi:fibronectin type 3 domain-containing protein